MGTNQMTRGRGRGQKFLKQNVEAPLSVRLTIGKLRFRVGRNKVHKTTYNVEGQVGKLGFRVGIILL